MSRRRKLLLIGATLTIAVVLLPVIAHYRAKAAAEKFKAQLRSQGEKLSIDELVPLPPLDMPNGARAFLDAVSRLTSFGYELQPGVMKMLQPGYGRICWQEATLPTEQSEDIWAGLRAYVETNRVALAELHEAIQQPVLDFQVQYHLGFNAGWSPLTQLKSASQRLSAAAVMAMRDGRTEEGFANLRALISLPAHHREEPFLISQLVRCAMIAIAASATWEGLHYPHWSEQQLAQLQAAWESLQVIPQMERALAMERACVLVEYARTRESMKRLDSMTAPGGTSNPLEALADAGNELMEDPAAGFESLLDRFPRRWVWKWWNCYDDEIWFLQNAQRVLDMSRETTNGRPYLPLLAELRAELQLAGETPRQFLVSRMLAPELYSKSIDKAIIAETQRRVVVTAIALKRFERRVGKLPTDLSTLVPEFLPAVPLDPMDGAPLRYRLSTTNTFVLYSIGLDGVDGGGDVNPKEPASRNFFWTQCKDFVWPQPATVEQLRDFNSQLEQKRARTSPRGRR
jgi:hypothetical protein